MRYDQVSTHSISCAADGSFASAGPAVALDANDGRISSPLGVRASTNAE